MPYHIRILGPADKPVAWAFVTWLRAFDPEAHDGRGKVEMTTDRRDAMTFDDSRAALELYRVVPRCHPVRAIDGRPNRPLTAYSIEIIDAAQEPLT